MAGTVKEISDRIAQITPAIDDSEESVRLLRTDEDTIVYADTENNALDGNRNATDNVNYDSSESAVLSLGKKFRVTGGDFLTFHIDTTSATLKLRDFIAGSGGFFRAADERAYVGYSEVTT